MNSNEKIKICHVVSGLKSGGVESVIYNYCSHIKNEEYEWHIIYQHSPYQKSINEFKKLGFKIKRIPSKSLRPLGNYFATKAYFRKNKIDIVHCHMTLMNFIPLYAAKRVGISARISHSHNNFVENNKIKLFLNTICKKMVKKYASTYIACGVDAGKYLYEDSNFIVLNNALDLDKYSYSKDKRDLIRKKYGIKDNDFIIGNIGRFTYQKNHEFMIELISILKKRLPNAKLLLVGDGENFDSIKQLIECNEVQDRVVMTGVVDNANDYYSAFDCFILPSRWEGLPVVGIEAQVSGLNCLMSDKIDSSVKILDSVRFIDITNSNKWIETIEQIYSSNSYKNRIINKELFRDNLLDIDCESKKLDDIYQKSFKLHNDSY